MEEAIKNFPNQLKFKPVIENKKNLVKRKKFIVSGMGGSHLAADILKMWKPSLNLIIHHDYGLPSAPDNLKNYLTIINSYSGNTEEAIDGFKLAVVKKIPVACISTGGELLELAKKHKKTYIQMPDTGVEPRSALGFSIISLLCLMGEKEALSNIAKMAGIIDMEKLKQTGQILAKKLNNFIPIIYTSAKNEPIACNWKIRFNETGKIPSFYNTIPELNHNEMVGFSGGDKTKGLSDKFYFIFLEEKTDHLKIILRMKTLKNILRENNFPVESIELEGKNVWEKTFFSLLLADWTSFYTALQYGLDPKKTEIISRFKKDIRR